MSTFRSVLLAAFTLLGACGVAVSAQAASTHHIHHTHAASLVAHHVHTRHHARHVAAVLPPV